MKGLSELCKLETSHYRVI